MGRIEVSLLSRNCCLGIVFHAALFAGCDCSEKERCGNGVLDPGEECDVGAGSRAACVNACGTAGEGTCRDDCTIAGCCAAAETCGNACDDDCDGEVEYVQTMANATVTGACYDFRPAIVFTGSEFGVACTGDDSIHLARMGTDGTPSGERVAVSGGSPQYPALVFTGSELAMAWEGSIDLGLGIYNHEIYFARFSPSGDRLTEDIRVTQDPDWSDMPDMVFTGSEFGIVWRDDRDGGDSIFFTRLSAAGDKAMEDADIVQAAGVDCYNPSLAFSGSEFAVAYFCMDGLDNAGLEFTRLSLEGIPVGSERLVEPASEHASPSLAFTGSGYGMAWDADILKFILISVDGSTAAPSVDISEAGSEPSLLFTGSRFAMAWSESGIISFATLSPQGDREGAGLRIGNPSEVLHSPVLAHASAGFGLAWGLIADGLQQEILFTTIGPCD